MLACLPLHRLGSTRTLEVLPPPPPPMLAHRPPWCLWCLWNPEDRARLYPLSHQVMVLEKLHHWNWHPIAVFLQANCHIFQNLWHVRFQTTYKIWYVAHVVFITISSLYIKFNSMGLKAEATITIRCCLLSGCLDYLVFNFISKSFQKLKSILLPE